MNAEKRSIHRISNRFGLDLTAICYLGNKKLIPTIVDYNSTGISLESEELVRDIKSGLKISDLKISYGQELLCRMSDPSMLRVEGSKLIVSLVATAKENNDREIRDRRIPVEDSHAGTLMGLDPYKLNQAIYFKVIDVSERGCRVRSSKTNRHITPGYKFKEMDLILPGIGIFKVNFTVTNTYLDGDSILFGGLLSSDSAEFKKAYTRYALVNSVDGDIEQRAKLLNAQILGNFSSLLRISRISNESDYQEVLKLRYSAYRAAEKITGNFDWKKMGDDYDDHSIVYAAYFGGFIVGTIRLVFPEENAKFPFEEYIEFSTLKYNRNECAEVSRLAVDPRIQGSDVFISLYRHIIVEIGAKKIKYPLCLATSKLAPYYRGIGAVRLTKDVPHPVLDNETMALYLFDPNKILKGRMSGLGWKYVASPSLKFLRKFGFIENMSSGVFNYLRLPFEVIWLAFRRKFLKRRK